MYKNILELKISRKELSSPFSDNIDKIETYLSDEASFPKGSADRVYFPKNSHDVSAVLQQANRTKTKVTVSAAGTSITGSRVPSCGGWILSVERMKKVSKENLPEGYKTVNHKNISFLLNAEQNLAIVTPGVHLSELDKALCQFDLVYPPDPTEMSAMLGGTVSTNASGARSFFYGSTRKWVDAIELVTPTGVVVNLSRGEYRFDGTKFVLKSGDKENTINFSETYPDINIKNVAGLYLKKDMDLVDLFIGAEGILGIITKIGLNLTKRPKEIMIFVAFFRTLGKSLDFIDSLREKNKDIKPLSIEFFDHNSLNFIREDFTDIPKDIDNAVLFETEYERPERYNPYPSEQTVNPIRKLLKKYQADTTWFIAGEDVKSIKKFRHSLPEKINIFARKRSGKLGTDMAVPLKKFRQMVDEYLKVSGVKTVLFGHIGDCHLHLNFLPRNDKELKIAKDLYLNLAKSAIKLGGTISAEHGVGKKTIPDTQYPYLKIMIGDHGLEEIRKIKQIFDPNMILNIGNMIPGETAR